MRGTSTRYNLVSALFAFALWGGWAYFVNRAAPGHAALVSALTQGACSFAITLLIVRAVGWVHRHSPAGVGRILFPPVITIACTGTLLAVSHVLAGTAELVQTISPPLAVAFGFALYTTIHLDRQRGKAHE